MSAYYLAVSSQGVLNTAIDFEISFGNGPFTLSVGRQNCFIMSAFKDKGIM